MSNQNTPSTKIKEEIKGHESMDTSVWENQRCLDHPQFKIDAISVNEDKNEFRLICIKCLLDPNKETGQSGYKLYTMKDLIQKCMDSLVTQGTRHHRYREEHEQIFLNFLTRDYVNEYEQILENQYKQVEHSIRGLIDSLNTLSEKYRSHFTKELQNVRDKGDIIKNKIKIFVGENNTEENSQLSNLNDIQEKLNSIANREQLHELMKQMYLKISSSLSDEDDKRDNRSTINLIEDIKHQVAAIQDRDLDLSPIDNINTIIKKMASQDGLTSIIRDMRQPEINYAPPVYKKQEKNESKNYSISSVEKEPLFSPPRTILKDENAEHKNYSIDNMPTIDKKMVKRRYLDIGSHSLRNLRKEFETKEDDLDQEAREKAVNSLNDWINRRITGYLIFQNTVSAGKGEDKLAYKEMGVHLNSVAGQKWKGLPEEEKEEYKMLAKYYRRIFRDEIYTYENYDDFTSLIEKLDIKIKKLKKE